MNKPGKAGEVRDRFIGEVGRLGESVGLNPTLCRMYALLYLEEGPLSLTELSRLLHISKGSASLNIRKLEEWGAVKPVWRKGSTQNYYQADRDLWAIARSRARSGLVRRLDLLEESLGKLDAGVKPGGRAAAGEAEILKAYRRRFREVREFAGKVKGLLEILG